MRRPRPYLVRAVVWLDGEPEDRVVAEALTLPAARRAARDEFNKTGDYVCILQRRNVVDVTPDGDPPGILWEWEQEVVEEP